MDLAAPEGAVYADFYELANLGEESVDEAVSLEPVSSAPVSETGTVSVTLRDKITLVTFSTEARVVEADTLDSGDVAATDVVSTADVTETEAEVESSSSSGGCNTSHAPAPGIVCIFAVALWALRRQRLSAFS